MSRCRRPTSEEALSECEVGDQGEGRRLRSGDREPEEAFGRGGEKEGASKAIDMKSGYLVERRRQAMQKRGMYEATKFVTLLHCNPPHPHLLCFREQIQEMPWSTGLFDIWTDPETLYIAGHGAWSGLYVANL
eukprot:656858-Hanusia_phi.AAC.1